MNKPATASSTSVLHSMGFKAFLATQFLGAFNDNVFKLLIICSAMNVLSPEASKSYVPLASAVFILPYLLFSGYAGFLADRYSKRQVMIGTKWLEVVIMLLGWWLFWQGAIYWLLPVLFLMGAQSAFFSPAKYGFLPEVLPEKHLPRGNGATQLFTFLAIIFGGWAGGELSEQFKDTLQNAAFFCVLVAILGVVTSYGITRTPSGNRSTRCAIDPLTPHLRTLLEVRRDPLLMTCFLGNTYFWFMGVLFQSNLAVMVKGQMAGTGRLVGFFPGRCRSRDRPGQCGLWLHVARQAVDAVRAASWLHDGSAGSAAGIDYQQGLAEHDGDSAAGIQHRLLPIAAEYDFAETQPGRQARTLSGRYERPGLRVHAASLRCSLAATESMQNASEPSFHRRWDNNRLRDDSAGPAAPARSGVQ